MASKTLTSNLEEKIDSLSKFQNEMTDSIRRLRADHNHSMNVISKISEENSELRTEIQMVKAQLSSMTTFKG